MNAQARPQEEPTEDSQKAPKAPSKEQSSDAGCTMRELRRRCFGEEWARWADLPPEEQEAEIRETEHEARELTKQLATTLVRTLQQQAACGGPSERQRARRRLQQLERVSRRGR